MEPFLGEAFIFGSEDEGGGGFEIEVPELILGVGGEGDRLDVVFFEKEEGFDGACLNDREVEEGALGGADGVGVVDIADGVAEDEGVCASGVGGAHEGPEVTGLLDALSDEEEGGVVELEVLEGAGALGGDREEAVRVFAVGGLGEDGFAELDDFDRAFADGLDEVDDLGAQEALGGEEEGAEFPTACYGTLEFAFAFDQEVAGASAVTGVAQAHEIFDPWVLQTGDQIGR